MMDNIEIFFFAFGLVLTALALAFFYFFIFEKPASPFAKQKTVNIDGFEVHYHSQGSGSPVLLIHGIGGTLHCWTDLVPMLAKFYRVISVDLPGFGQSSKNENVEYGLDAQADRLEKFLTALKIDRAILIGHSMGGNLALWLARLHPSRFPDVVVIGPAAHPKLVPWGIGLGGWLARPAAWLFRKPIATFAHRQSRGRPELLTEDHVSHTLDIYQNNPAAIRTFFAATAAIKDPRLLSETFESRVLVLYGKRDKVVPYWAIESLMPRLPDAKLAVHPQGGHLLQHDDPQWTFEQIRIFLPARLD